MVIWKNLRTLEVTVIWNSLHQIYIALRSDSANTYAFFSWLRRRCNSSSSVIAGAEDEQYQLTIDDVDSSLVFMYTSVTEEGAKGLSTFRDSSN
ncbi:187-kDa microtubule-associated protein AIR9-like isoform X2 [Durio zibethinus]|uniref:187-kDa microtubule-associated protein AIR9-like isoform X2 n=1 Tax=Durio zibethinus TaxID=66656 RepID=A0A6P5XG52_DURZI|nr:187-kDa microtubule-associated protein AIR9-like isoform X2 [Durio zibethinus]